MSYAKLHDHFASIGQLDEIAQIVEWDQAVNTPEAAGPNRARAIGTLARTRHELCADPRVGEWLESLKSLPADAPEQPSTDWERANLDLMARIHRRACAIPGALAAESAQLEKVSEQAWRHCREDNDFDGFVPYLERIVESKRRIGEALGDALGMSPYEALLDGFEPGMRQHEVDSVFAKLRGFLPNLTERVTAQQREAEIKAPLSLPPGPFAERQQEQLAKSLMQASGLDMTRARLDRSHHPFCGGVPSDVRLTTRYDADDFAGALMGVLHEAGHAKYEQGLPSQWAHQPVGQARGMVLHESQSLLQEMQVCRGLDYFHFLSPLLRATFPESHRKSPAAYEPENLQRLATRVEPGFIRVDADEVTYPAHVMLRYDLEKQLIAGQLRVRELPEAWDASMRCLLGLSTGHDHRKGCLQDIHWPIGAFGYFPLYTLGAVVAAQLFSAARAALPDVYDMIRQGNFRPLNEWLHEHVWRWGSYLGPNELLRKITGRGIDASAFQTHLEARYLHP